MCLRITSDLSSAFNEKFMKQLGRWYNFDCKCPHNKVLDVKDLPNN